MKNDYTIIIQDNCIIKVRTDLLKTNLKELYNDDENKKYGDNIDKFQILGWEDLDDLIETIQEMI